MAVRNSDIHITKTGDDIYAVKIPDLYVDEERINGPQLLGMLASKRLVQTTKETVLNTLDGVEVGHKVSIKFENTM
jgi:hypothetical protein